MSDDGATASSLGSDYESAEQSPGLALWQVTNRWQAAMRGALRPHDLTHVQYVLLASIVWMHAHDRESVITQVDLAQFAATDRMMTSQVLRALEAKLLIVREHHPTDGRARALRPTQAGITAARHATRDVEAADRVFFAPLGEKAGSFVAGLAVLVGAGASPVAPAEPGGLPG